MTTTTALAFGASARADTAPDATSASASGSVTNEYEWTATHNANGDIYLSPATPLSHQEAAAIGYENSLSVGTIYFTGDYKTVSVSGPHVTQVPVYKRSYSACFAGNTFWRQCTSGVIVFANGYATCGLSCSIIQNRGSHDCSTAGSNAIGYNVDNTGCGEVRFRCGVALSLWERDVVSVDVPLAAHRTFDWHVNAYSTGAMTGPYNGVGGDPTC